MMEIGTGLKEDEMVSKAHGSIRRLAACTLAVSVLSAILARFRRPEPQAFSPRWAVLRHRGQSAEAVDHGRVEGRLIEQIRRMASAVGIVSSSPVQRRRGLTGPSASMPTAPASRTSKPPHSLRLPTQE